MSRLAVRAVGVATRDHEVGSVSERWGRDNKGDGNDDDEVTGDEVIQ